jgi:hypothetical protein
MKAAARERGVISTRRRSPPGELVRVSIGQVSEVQLVEQLAEPLLPRATRQAHGLEHGQNVLAHGQATEDARLLRQVAEPHARPAGTWARR